MSLHHKAPLSKVTTDMKTLSLKDPPSVPIPLNPTTQKFGAPCKYYKSGTCKLGDQCRFVHSNAPIISTFTPQINMQINKVENSNSNLTSRGLIPFSNGDSHIFSVPTQHHTPSMHNPNGLSTFIHHTNVAVPFAGAASSVVPKLAQGEDGPFLVLSEKEKLQSMNKMARRPYIHTIIMYASDQRVMRYAKEVEAVFLACGIDVSIQTEDPSGQHVKTDNLAEIITASTGDQVIVLGDRNMKNRSCQVKRKGRLIEIALDDLINLTWQEFQSVADSMPFPFPIEEELGDANIEKMTDEQVHIMLERYVQLKHIKDRVSKIKSAVDELKDKKGTKKGNTIVLDEKSARILTTAQKSAIRLHQQLVEAQDTLRNMPIVEITQPAFAILGRGSIVPMDYTPSTASSTPPGIAEGVKSKLLTEIKKTTPRVETWGDLLSEFGAPLWEAYKTEYLKSKKVVEGKPSKPQQNGGTTNPTSSGNKWSCPACTFLNDSQVTKCLICEASVPTEFVKSHNAGPAEDWALTGVAGKKQRKKMKEIEERVTKEKEDEERKRLEKEKEEDRIRKEHEMKKLAEQKLKEEKKKAALNKQNVINNVPITSSSPPISLTSNNGINLMVPNVSQLPNKVPSPLMFTTQNGSFIQQQQQQTLPPSPIYPPANREYDNTFPPLGVNANIIERHGNVTTPPLQQSAQNAPITQDIPHIGLWNKKSSTGLTNPPSPPSTTPPITNNANTFQSQILPAQQNKYQLPFQGISVFSTTPFINQANNPIPNNSNPNNTNTNNNNNNNNEIYSRQQTQGMYDYSNVLSNLWMNNQNSPFYQSYTPNSIPLSSNSLNLSNNLNNNTNNNNNINHSNINNNINNNNNTNEGYLQADWSSAFRSPNMPIGQTMLYDQYPTSTLFGNTSVSPFFQNFQPSNSLNSSNIQNLPSNQVTSSSFPLSNINMEGSLIDQLERDRVKAREAVLQKYQNILPPQRPCCYCGEESSLECNVCAKTGYATFFCSPEHQSLMWKEHMRVHQAYLASLQQQQK